MTNDNISPLTKFVTLNFWKSLSPETVLRFKDGGVDVSRIKEISSEELPIIGQVPSSNLLRVNLKDETGNIIWPGCIKTYEFSHMVDSVQKKQSAQSLDPFYQVLQSDFCNRRYLPVTKIYAKETLEIKDKDDKRKKNLSNLLMDFWPEPSLDLHFFYLESLIENYMEKMIDPKFKDDLEVQEKLKSGINEIKKLKTELFKSAIDTILEFAIYGTYFKKYGNEKDRNHDIFKLMPDEKECLSVKKAQDMGRYALLYKEIMDDSITFADIKQNNIPASIQKKSDEISSGLEKLVPVLMKPLLDEDKRVYQQGDETLNHFVYRQFNNIKKMGVLDLCRAREDNLAVPLTKLLLGYLQNLNHKEVDELLNYAVQKKAGLEEIFKEEIGADELKVHIPLEENEFKGAFDMNSIYELWKQAGRIAYFYAFEDEDKSENYTKNIAMAMKKYDPKYLHSFNNSLSLPQEINFRTRLPKEQLITTLSLLRERMDSIGEAKYIDDKEKKDVADFCTIFKKYMTLKSS